MIARTSIESNLKRLDNKYNQSKIHKDKLFYAKLAMLELCGWIEESMDDIVKKCANRIIRDPTYRNRVENEIIKPIYGFEYNKHFMKMLTSLIGFINVIKLEKRLDNVKKQLLSTTLGNLKVIRNSEAHTHIKGVTRQIKAPSYALLYFKDVYDGLKDIDDNLRVMFP